MRIAFNSTNQDLALSWTYLTSSLLLQASSRSLKRRDQGELKFDAGNHSLARLEAQSGGVLACWNEERKHSSVRVVELISGCEGVVVFLVILKHLDGISQHEVALDRARGRIGSSQDSKLQHGT